MEQSAEEWLREKNRLMLECVSRSANVIADAIEAAPEGPAKAELATALAGLMEAWVKF